MEAFIKFFFAHINIIIYVLGLITVLLIGVMTFLNLGNDSDNSKGGGAGLDNNKISDLENLLKKMIDSAQTKVPVSGVVDTEEKPVKEAPAAAAPQQVVVKEVDSGALNEVKAEVQTLKNAVNEKEAIIAKLKSSLELAQQEQTKKAAPGQQMQEKLRELEAKLAEYEIIEDDIADLTMYKEENAQLKEQIKQLMKGQGAAAPVEVAAPASTPTPVAEVAAPASTPTPVAEVAAPAPAPVIENAEPVAAQPVLAPEPEPSAPAPAPQAEAVTDDLLEQFKQALTEKPETPAPASIVAPSTNQPPSPQVAEQVSDDLMSEFENALSEQRKSDSAPIQIQGPIPTFPIDGDSGGGETHDIMAEFVTDALTDDGTNVHMPIDTMSTITAANDPLAATDPNKMISEVESLTTNSGDADGNALEGDTDTDKMLKEMEDFKKLASGE